MDSFNFINILYAIGTGVVASLVFFLIMLIVRPRIAISKYICYKSNDPIYYIKVVNKSLVKLVDVTYSLEYVKLSSDNICETDVIEPIKTPCRILDQRRPIYDMKHKQFDNAIHFSYDLNESKYPVEANKSILVFTIVARHSLSGTIAYKSMQFDHNSIKKDAVFSRDMSLEFQKI